MYIDGTAWLFLESLSTGFEVSTRKGHPVRMCTTSHFTRCRTTYYEYAYQVPRYFYYEYAHQVPLATYYEHAYQVPHYLL
jgi:hypothetical protein